MKQLQFYALRDDLTPVLDAVDAAIAVTYTLAGSSKQREPEVYEHGRNLPHLGEASADSSIASVSFLVSERGRPVAVRSVRGVDGERFLIDQLINPDSVMLTPAGRWGDDVIVHGRVATVSTSATSNRLMKAFAKAFEGTFRKIKSFRVGPLAERELDKGTRLTMSARSPREYDLTRDR